MTNRERINNMSDEELYEFIVGDELERLKFENISFHEHFLDLLKQDYNTTDVWNFLFEFIDNEHKVCFEPILSQSGERIFIRTTDFVRAQEFIEEHFENENLKYLGCFSDDEARFLGCFGNYRIVQQ